MKTDDDRMERPHKIITFSSILFSIHLFILDIGKCYISRVYFRYQVFSFSFPYSLSLSLCNRRKMRHLDSKRRTKQINSLRTHFFISKRLCLISYCKDKEFDQNN